MARLEIELVGINKNLKQTLKDSKTDLTAFAKTINGIKPTGINALNTSLKTTKKLLSDIAKQAKQAADAVNAINRAQNGQGTSFIPPGQDAEIDRARQAEARYREETQRLTAALAQLRLANAQSRQQTTAASGSYREAQQRLTALGRAIREAEGGFNSTNPAIQNQIREYRTLNERLQAFDRQLGNHQRNVGNYRSALNGLKGLAASYFGFQSLIAIGKRVLDNNAQISDSLADVRRTAGLTAVEAENLSRALKTIDTRTSLKDLLGIATIGGQLGISKDQLAGFTKAVDQLSVALGGELQGGAEGIAKSLGVLDNVFDVTKNNAGDVNKAYNKIGSAILGLGQSGLATGDFLADFGERVGGAAKQAGLALPVILAYGAVLQENGVSAEVAGSAFKRLLSAISSNSAGFFKVAKLADANLTLKDFTTIINTDAKKALDLFFAGLQKGGSSTVAFNTILKSLKLSGSGVSQVIAALSSNQQELNGHIIEATNDFKAGTLASEQFKIKNDNLAGSIDKLGNKFVNLTTSGAIGGFFKAIVDGASDATDALGDLLASRSFTELITRLTPFLSNKRFDVANSLVDNFKQRKSTSYDLNSVYDKKEVQGAKVGLTELKDAYTKANEAQRQAAVDYQKFQAGLKSGDLKNTNGQLESLRNQFFYLREQTAYFAKEYVKARGIVKNNPITKRSNAGVPDGFGLKKGGSSKVPVAPNILPILAGSENSGLDGVDKQISEAQQKYSAYYGKLDEYNKKKNANIAKSDQLRAQAQIAEGKEVSNIIANENQRVADEIAAINEKAGVVREASRLKDLQANEAYYNEQVRAYAGQAEVLTALENARLQERSNINKKYDDEIIQKAQELQDKIVDVQDKAFTENIKGNERGRAKVKEQLENRLKDIQSFFDKLRELYKNDPIATIGINAAQLGVTQNVKAAASTAASPVLTQQKEAIRGVVESFGRDLSNTLQNLGNEADSTFEGIFSTLTNGLIKALNDVSFSQFSKKLSDALLNGGSLKLSGAEAASLGLGAAGGLVSGLTKKTSFVGQGLGGALSGAGAGAAIGSVIPGLGTLAGGLIGGALGAIGGLFGAGKAKKEEQAQQRLLEEQKKQTALLERANALAYASQIVGRNTVNGIVTGVDINEFGQVITKVSGNDLLIIHDRSVKNRNRGK